MHELSLAATMLEQIAPMIKNKRDLRKVTITVGPLAGVYADSLQFMFTELARVEGYPGVELIINSVTAKVKCDSCLVEYEAECFETVCPQCAGISRTVLSGRELTLDSIEVEEEHV